MTRIWCWVGVHRWQVVRTEDGRPYRRCRRCGKDDTRGDGFNEGAVGFGAVASPGP
jgi:hypothetical protein